MYAVSSGNYELVKFLLDNGANKNLNTIHGNDAIFFAIKYKHDEILKLITKESSVEEVLKRTAELLKKDGYDIDNSPPLTEQQRDEFETVLHNAKRTGKFDWDIKK
jgi:ankyrin repeat protein